MEQNAKTLADYIDIVIRRKFSIFVPFLLIGTASIIVAYNLPRTYRSTATMLMEAPIPKSVIQSTIPEYAEGQINSVAQKVITAESVLELINSYHLYGDIINSDNKDKMTDIFKRNTEISLVESKLGGKNIAASTSIAFTISFIYS